MNVLIVSGTNSRDNDNDGYGDITSAMWKCEQPEGYSNQKVGDCDDTNHLIYPGVAEVIGDGVDQIVMVLKVAIVMQTMMVMGVLIPS